MRRGVVADGETLACTTEAGGSSPADLAENVTPYLLPDEIHLVSMNFYLDLSYPVLHSSSKRKS